MSGEQKQQEKDIFRDTWVRYFGYTNEVGESIRPLVHKYIVHGTYVAASAYVVADTVDKAVKANRMLKARDDIAPSDVKKLVTSEAVDCLVWQSLASVAIPGFTINTIVRFSKSLLTRANAPVKAITALPTLIGLASIPLIIHPIDSLVHFGMDKTIRPPLRAWGGNLTKEEHGEKKKE